MHINCLELIAASLAVKCFAKDKTNLTFHLKMDSILALTFINKLGGTISPQLNSLAKELMLYGEDHSPQSPAPGRCVKHHSRRRFTCHEELVRLETVPSSAPSDKPDTMTSGDGPVCHQTDSPAADICQLETRPDGHGHGHIHSGLG